MKRLCLNLLIVIIVVGTIVTPFWSAAQSRPRTSFQEVPRSANTPVVPVSQPPSTIALDIWMNKACGSPYYTGEKALIYFKANADGYVTLYDIGPQGNVLIIFPNQHTPDNYVRAGRTYQFPSPEANYDLVVEGQEGIEYVEAVASTDPYYHWNYRQGEPRWLEDLGLKGRKMQEVKARDTTPTIITALKNSTELQNLPKEFGAIGQKSLTQNFQLSQDLREQVRSKLSERPRETSQQPAQPVKTTVDYNTASCYFYVVASAVSPQTQPRQPVPQQPERPRQQPQPLPQAAVQPINIDLWFDKQCAASYYPGDPLAVFFKTDTNGYVTLYEIDPTGNVAVIFPNQANADNFVRAGQTYQIPAQNAGYLFLVQGPQGTKYVDAVASTDPYYHWDYRQGEPRWLEEWGLTRRASQDLKVRETSPSVMTALRNSLELKKLPKELGTLGQKNLTQNFQLAQGLREQVRSKLAERPRQTQPVTQPASTTVDYSLASCYAYVIEKPVPPTQPPRAQIPPTPLPTSRSTIDVDLWFDKQCGSPYYTGEKIAIYFSANADGYVTLYDIGTTGNVLVVFPNQHIPDNYVKAGQTYVIPNERYAYDLIVEGPEGIEYVNAVASQDPYYRWNYNQGEPRWLQDWGLQGQKSRDIQARETNQSVMTALKNSGEFKNLPKDLGTTGQQSLTHNFQIAQDLQQQVRSKLAERPRETTQPAAQPVSATVDYSTTSCYLYVVERTAPLPSNVDYLRQQEQDLQQIPKFEVRRIENRLIVEMPNQMLFDVNSFALRGDVQQSLIQVANVLLRYPDTTIVVAGHTDDTGSEAYNQRLSETRAQAVSNYLLRQGVQPLRIKWMGYGETMPIASNYTEAGRQRNRRVELEIRVRE